MKKLKLLVLIPALVLLAACSRYTPHIYNVKNAHISAPKGVKVTSAKVNRAILIATASRGWTARTVRPGYVVATLHLRGHMAKVGIPYNTKYYSIKYITSQNLKRNGEIHVNYNSWVKNLQTSINLQIASLKK